MSQGAELSITVAYSTMGHRLHGLALPGPCAGVDYVVLVQKPTETTARAFSERADVRVVPLPSLGLSHSRNAALAEATGALLVFMDDDLILDLTGLRNMAAEFARDPALGFAAGWRKDYYEARGMPPDRAVFSLFNSGRICAPELMVRTDALARSSVQFDTEFGLGATHGLGEEYVFVSDMLRANLKGVSLPIVMGEHPEDSTGQTWDDPELMSARVALLSRVFGVWAFVIRPIYIWRHRRRVPRWGDRVRFALGLPFLKK